MFIKVYDCFQLELTDLIGSGSPNYDLRQHLIDLLTQVLVEKFPTHRMVNRCDTTLIFLEVSTEHPKNRLAVIITVINRVHFQKLRPFVHEHPIEEIINIPKVVVKCLD